MSYLQASPGTGGGGGGGGAFTSITGTPTQIAYFDLAGNGTGDSLATRLANGNTIIKKAVSGSLTQGFEIGATLFGLNSALISGVNTSLTNAAYVGTIDISSFGQSSTTAIMAATDALGNTQTVTLSPVGFNTNVTNGTSQGGYSASTSAITMNWQTSGSVRSRFSGDTTRTFMQHHDGTNDWRIGADTGIYLEKAGSKMYFPSAVQAPGAGYVWTTTGTGTSSWQLPTAGTPAGSDREIQFNNAGAFGASNVLKFSSIGTFEVLQTNGNGPILSVLSSSGLHQIGSASQNYYMDSSIPGKYFEFFGNGDDTNTGLVYTPIGAPGLNDVSFVGNFKGIISPTTYTATVDGVNVAIFVTDTPGAPGINQGHTIEAYLGGTLLATGTVLSSVQNYPVSGAVVIDFSGVDISTADRIVDLDNATTYIGSFYGLTDSVTYVISNTGGTVTLEGYPILPTAIYENQGISVIGLASTGHTLGDEWSNSFTLTYTRMVKFDGLNNRLTHQIYSDNGKLAALYIGDTSGGGIDESYGSQLAFDATVPDSDLKAQFRIDTNNGFNFKSYSTGGSIMAELEMNNGGIFNRTATWGITSVGGDDLITASATNKAVKISGAWITENWTDFTSGVSITIQDNRSGFIYNPASVVASATITLPAGAGSGSNITLVFGGTVTSGAVVTSLTIAPNSGQSIIDALPPTTAVAGDAFIYHLEGTVWYRIK